MSAKFRQKIADELGAASGTAYNKLIPTLFAHGHVQIKREHWAQTYINALVAVFSSSREYEGQTGAVSEMEFTDIEWKTFAEGVAKKLQNKGSVIWGHKSGFAPFDYDLNQITFYYKKSQQASLKAKNIDAKAEELMKLATAAFFDDSRVFRKQAKERIEAAQVYEHGTRQENLMSDDHPGDASKKISGLEGRGSRAKMKEGLASGITASGAAGVKTDNRLIAALIKELRTQFFKGKNWYIPVHNIVIAKWADLFGYDTEIESIDKVAKIKSELKLKAVMVPDGISYNKGNFDNALREHLQKFLTDKKFFIKETKRLIEKGAISNVFFIDKLFSDSPGPTKRIEAAAIKLAAVNITEGLTKKVLKNKSNLDKAKKGYKTGRKRSTSKTRRPKGGKFKTKTKSARVAKRGRPTKQQQAIRGNVLALKELINKMLPDVILQKMQSPALVNRTGRFRRSAEVTNAMIGPRGGVQIDYTYARDPYEVFEPGSGSPLANQYRDPRRIIGGSVREIAQSIMGKKFVRVRRV